MIIPTTPRIIRICITIFILTISLNYTYGQNNLNDAITIFKANCSYEISPEDDFPEFTVLKLSTTNECTALNFEIIANCAQKQQGILSVSGDTLIIDQTDLNVSNSIYYEKFDSITGHTIQITEETHIVDIVFCDCLVNFYYELSIPIQNINFLTFHQRTFSISKTE